MDIKINFLDGTVRSYKSDKASELDSVDEAIRSARNEGIESPVLFYDSAPSNLKSIINSHA